MVSRTQQRPQCSLFILDLANPYRYMDVRGTAEIAPDDDYAFATKVGAKHGVSVARVALAWTLAKPFVMSVIIGAKTIEQLEDNLAAAELTLTPEEIAQLDAANS